MSRREQRTARRLRAVTRAAWRRSTLPGLAKSRPRPERINQKVARCRHQREMVRKLLGGEMPTYGKPLNWARIAEEASAHAMDALKCWREAGAAAVKGSKKAQATIAAIAADAGIENPFEVNHDENEQI